MWMCLEAVLLLGAMPPWALLAASPPQAHNLDRDCDDHRLCIGSKRLVRTSPHKCGQILGRLQALHSCMLLKN